MGTSPPLLSFSLLLIIIIYLYLLSRAELTKVSQLKKGPEGESPMVRIEELAEESEDWGEDGDVDEIDEQWVDDEDIEDLTASPMDTVIHNLHYDATRLMGVRFGKAQMPLH